jgi:chromosome partitioning protein
MLVITCWAAKGGIGKSTVCAGIAELAAMGAPTVLVDCDPQGSVTDWARLARDSGQPLRSRVVPIPAADLGRRFAAETRGASVVVVDTPPPGPGAAAIVGAAIDAADIVILPLPPENAVLARAIATHAEIRRHGKPALAALTMVRAGLADREVSRSALTTWGIPVAKAELPLAVSVSRCYGQHVTGALAHFSLDLLAEILDVLEVKTDG